ncbi:Hpt domain-containing protein [Chitinivorax sp. B]|uniref:hybrid sensor histidine kinase/response regulator n=1 Tax=Chitinivorax sp. B TaxID=2502235 RepID=UPI0010F89738|nr:Hpt domain-containing protein [Chitinivorax sp. B]
MRVHSEFDVGSLVWVKAEIDQALERAKTCLEQYRASPADTSQLKFGRTHLHQVTGALQMVGLDGAARVSEEMELALGAIEKGETESTADVLDALAAAVDGCGRYLEALMNGTPDMPLRLYPEYERIKLARGITKVSPSDLFFPSLDAFSLPANAAPVADSDLPALVKAQRARYELGLLKWLRGGEDGLLIMAQTLRAIETAVRSPRQRTFWWTAAGLVEAIASKAVDIDYVAKQLFARINIQLRRLAEGSQTVADRLQRDILYYLARSSEATDTLRQIKQSFALDELMPADDVPESSVDAARQKAARAMRDLLTQAKDAWARAAGGQADKLTLVIDSLAGLVNKSVVFDLDGLQPCLQNLQAAVHSVQGNPISEAAALDVATAFLLLDALCEHPVNPPQELPGQLQAMSARLDALARTGKIDASLPDLPQLDELARDAQAKMLQSQLMHEIQVNLQHIEQGLDAFFRDSSKRGELAGLQPYFRQIQGALAITELNDAAELLGWSQETTARYEDAGVELNPAELELLAEVLSALGFYVEATQNDRPNRQEILRPMLRKLRGETESVNEAATEEATVESEVSQQKQQAQELLEVLRDNPKDQAAQQQLKATLQTLQQNADLIADNALGQQSAAALSALKEAEGKPIEALVATVSEMVGEKVKPVVEAQPKPAPVSDEAVDQELLEVYLEEAVDVLANIRSNLEIITASPRDKEALTVIRRSYHTLKGSGRMVGLNHLGEVAWSVEQVMNKVLQDDLPATAGVLRLVNMSHDSFAVWIDELRDKGSASVEASEIFELAEALKAGEEPPAPSSAVRGPEAALDLPSLESVAELEPASLDVPTLDLAEAVPPAEVPSILEPAFELSFGTEPVTAEPVEASEPDEVDLHIGDVVISSVLFDIFTNEAARYLSTLNQQQALLREHPGRAVSDQFLHAAHTLCGICRTAGFQDMGELGHGLELCIQGQMKAPERLDSADIETFAEAIAQLDVMFLTINAKLAPPAAPELVQKLDEVATRLRAPSDVPLVDEVEAPPAPVNEGFSFELPTLEAVPGDVTPAALTWDDTVVESPAVSLDIIAEHEIGLSFDTDEQGPLEPGMPITEPIGLDDLPEDALLAIDLPEVEALDQDQYLVEEPIELTPPEALPAIELVPAEMEPSDTLPVIGLAESPDLPSVTQEIAAPAAVEASVSEPVVHDELSVNLDEPVIELPAVDVFPEQPAVEAEPVSESAPVVNVIADVELEVDAPQADQEQEDEQPVLDVVIPDEPVEILSPVTPAVQVVPSFDAVPAEETAEATYSVQDDIDEQLLPVFIEEVNDLQPQISKVMRDWRTDPAAYEMSKALQRLLHTLKGSARMTGAMRLGEATHNLETKVIGLQETAPTSDDFDELESQLDQVNELIDILQGKSSAETAADVVAASQAAGNLAIPAMPMGLVDADAAKSTLRVRADLVDRLVNQAGEVAIARSRMEAEMLALKQSLLDLTDNVTRLRTQLREIEIQAESQMASRMSHIQTDNEFDPLEFDRFTRLQELTRFMAESVNDVATIQHNLLKNLDETDAALLQQGRMTKDLQQELMRIRMVPFSSVSERLYRIVRQTGKEVGKKVNLEIRGGRVEIDRSMLEKMTSPFEHMLRNAIDHGLESREKRIEAGKPEVGEISLSLKQEGNELVLILADDGAGLNLGKIREKAISKGLITADQVLSDEEAMYLIFEPGFSTADALSQLSGRGIGMDVVKNEISDLGGRVQLDSEIGKGTRFTIHLPLTLAVTQTVLVTAANKKYAIPSVMVEQVQELKLADLERLYEQKKATWLGNEYPFTYLPRLLGDQEHQPESKRYSTIVLLRSGSQRIALHVDDLMRNQEVVVKNIGPQLARVPGIAGATVLGNGDIVLILNPLLLLNRIETANAQQQGQAQGQAPVQSQPDALSMVPVVMVVDDSLTVRKITGRLLAREGFQVITAKDGVDALQQIQDVMPDVMLVDIEMPRMDGFELTRHIRSDEKTRHIPIIMITSRTAEKHRNYANELGVNVYLGKPYQEDELLGHIERFVEHKKARQV